MSDIHCVITIRRAGAVCATFRECPSTWQFARPGRALGPSPDSPRRHFGGLLTTRGVAPARHPPPLGSGSGGHACCLSGGCAKPRGARARAPSLDGRGATEARSVAAASTFVISQPRLAPSVAAAVAIAARFPQRPFIALWCSALLPGHPLPSPLCHSPAARSRRSRPTPPLLPPFWWSPCRLRPSLSMGSL